VTVSPLARHQHFSGWTLVVVATATLVAIPVLIVLSSLLNPQNGPVWQHLVQTVLADYVQNSLGLMLGVAVGVSLVGTATAWLVTMCRFPGSRWLAWGLLLPLATPTYLLAYTLTEFLDFYGPLQSLLRRGFGWQNPQDYWFPTIRSLPGAIVLFSLTLYPYVYLLARSSFLEQSARTLEASRCLGCGPWQSFYRVALPLARPAISAGLALALMETLNDFGTVQYFGIPTFTTGIYRTWLGMGEKSAAAQLSAVLLLFILMLVLLERWSRRQARFFEAGSQYQSMGHYTLQGWRALAAIALCLFPLLVSLVLPMAILLRLIWLTPPSEDAQFWSLVGNSFGLACAAACAAALLSLVLAYAQRQQSQPWLLSLVRLAVIGYAVPGAVLAVGILTAFGWTDELINQVSQGLTGHTLGLVVSGSVLGLIFAYLVRFLAVSFSPIESSLGKIRPSLDEASRCLGCSATETLYSIHAPLMTSSVLTAILLVFVDAMKELSATIVMRPFNFDTLAVRVYQYASDERLAEAAMPALTILAVGLLPVILLTMRITHSRELLP
jgi:iron(III) transport system permease protein